MGHHFNESVSVFAKTQTLAVAFLGLVAESRVTLVKHPAVVVVVGSLGVSGGGCLRVASML